MRLISSALVIAMLSLGLQACGGSGDSATSNANPPPPPPPASNRAPTISGSPATSVTAGQSYSFTPQASDPEGATLTFSITNRPAWATFSSSTGGLSGTPAAGNVGTTSGIVISVTDGTNSVSLASFSIQVTAATTPPPVTGSATLTWQPPTERTDGSTLSNLSGYRIYYGTSQGNYSNTASVTNPGLTSYVIENLAGGTWYFVMTAVDGAGLESARTNPVSKTIS